MDRIRYLLALVLLSSCVPQTQTEPGADYGKLVGSWKSRADTSLVLAFSRVCCGSKPEIQGSLRWMGRQSALDSLNYVSLYPIQMPDSATEYSFEIILFPHLETICSIDGFVLDRDGRRSLSQPIIPDSAVLALTLSRRTEHGCDSLWAPMIFERER
jgi:hypothetical protein